MERFLSRAGCELARARVSLALDEELGWLGAARLRAHLALCLSCREHRRELHLLTAILRDGSRSAESLIIRSRIRVAARLVPVATAAAALAIAVGPASHRDQRGYRGGALPATQEMPAYDTSPSQLARLVR